MFLIYNKDKIISALIALSTVLVLFLVAATIKTNNIQKTIQTSSNASKLLPIYAVKTNKSDVALTINCAWNADDIDLILETLAKNQVKATFHKLICHLYIFSDKVSAKILGPFLIGLFAFF